jgi:hypothetical protein
MRWQLDKFDLGVGGADALRCELRHGFFKAVFLVVNVAATKKWRARMLRPLLFGCHGSAQEEK